MKKKEIILILSLIFLLAAILGFRYKQKCQNIIGDGYAMGLEDEPIVIANSCDGQSFYERFF